MSTTVLICYDDSSEARASLDRAAELFEGARAIVVCLWRPAVAEAVAPAARPPISDPVDVDDVPQEAAAEIAAEGARRAAAAGLDPEPVTREAAGSMWEAIEAIAEARDATVVLCGTGRSGMRWALPGHLPQALVAHISRPVLVVPSPRAAEERRREALDRKRRRAPRYRPARL